MIWLGFILLEIARNYYLIEVKKTRPDYLHSFVIRGMAAIIHGALLGLQTWSEYLPIFVSQTVSFWILFDLGLNVARKKPLTHKGETSGYLDRLPKWLYWTLKLASTIFAVIIYYLN